MDNEKDMGPKSAGYCELPKAGSVTAECKFYYPCRATCVDQGAGLGHVPTSHEEVAIEFCLEGRFLNAKTLMAESGRPVARASQCAAALSRLEAIVGESGPNKVAPSKGGPYKGDVQLVQRVKGGA